MIKIHRGGLSKMFLFRVNIYRYILVHVHLKSSEKDHLPTLNSQNADVTQ